MEDLTEEEAEFALVAMHFSSAVRDPDYPVKCPEAQLGLAFDWFMAGWAASEANRRSQEGK